MLIDLDNDQWFDLQCLTSPYLWMPLSAAMEIMMEVFNEDRLEHPWNSHVCMVPRLMTQWWQKNLGKDGNVLFTAQVGSQFWSEAQHELLTISIILPLAYIDNYRGP